MNESKKLSLTVTDVTALSSAVSACWDNYKTLKLRNPENKKTPGMLESSRSYFNTGYILDLRSFLGDRFKLVSPVFAQFGKEVSAEYEEKQTRNNYPLGEAWYKGRLTNLYGFSASLNKAKESQRNNLLNFEVQI